MKNLGITDIFNSEISDFTPMTDSKGIYVSKINHAVRVAIDEKGVTAAAYIEIPGAGAAAPPEEIIDFILDRPFLFMITNSGIPLFAGTVNQP